MNTVTFNSYNLNDQDNGIYAVRVQHGSFAERDIDMMQIGREDGLALIDAKFNQKVIPIEISIHKSNEDDLTTALHTIKEYLAGVDKDLVLQGEDDATALVYKATVKSMNEIRYDKFTAKLQVDFYAPLGRAKSQTQSNNSWDNIIVWQTQDTVTIDGSYPAKPVITITFNTGGTCDSVQFTNSTTNTQIQVDHATGTFSDGDILIINCENKTVTLNSVDYDFDGVFPLFNKGSNSFTINFFGNSTGLDQSQTTADSDELIDANDDRIAQGFQPGSTDTMPRVDLLLKKAWSPRSTIYAGSVDGDNSKVFGPGRRNVIFDTNGKVAVVYPLLVGSYTEIKFAYSTNNGNSWTVQNVTSGSSGNQDYPSIAIDSDGHCHISWVGHNGTYDNQIRYIKNTGIGTSFGSIVEATNNSTRYYGYDGIAIDSNDYPHIICKSQTTAYSDERIDIVSWNGSSFDSPVQVDSDENTWVTAPTIAIGPSDYIHVAWESWSSSPNNNHRIIYRRYTTSWQSTEVAVDTTYSNVRPCIAVDSNGYVHMSFSRYSEGGSGRIKYIERTTSWQSEVNIFTDTNTYNQSNGMSSISLDQNENIYIMIHDNQTDLSYVYNTGSGWSSMIEIDGSGTSWLDGAIGSCGAYYPLSSGVSTANVESGVIAVSVGTSDYPYIYFVNDLVVEIQTDTAGDPSGTIVTNAKGYILNSDITTSPTWLACNFGTAPSLSASTQYHIVIRSFGLYSTSRNFVWRHNSAGGYADGLMKTSVNAGSTWTDITGEDACFKTYIGGTADQDADLDINYYPNYL